jgi:hypothetical protein
MKLNNCSIAASPVLLSVFLLTFSATPSRAAIDDSVPAPAFIAQLELKAAQAKPREQCFLYTELVHSMTQLAGKQFSDGEYQKADATLKQIEHYAQLIHMDLAHDTKRLKDAEILMQHSTEHMSDYMRHASSDDRPALQTALKQLDHVHDELLTQVFAH